ncbi:hypothetical protein C8R45DRAFT_1220977 [Mycena sanguinolenta]|nr:hypothetical protein C8R45DRAFT_1220977 [Mycena sanguinolenta]
MCWLPKLAMLPTEFDSFAAMDDTTFDVDMFDVSLDCNMDSSEIPVPPNRWWVPTEEYLPPISELAGDSAPPPAYETYTIPPADIPPEIWMEESSRMDEDAPPRATRKPNASPSFDKPILFAPRITKPPTQASGVAWRRHRSDARIVFGPRPKARKLQREARRQFEGPTPQHGSRTSLPSSSSSSEWDSDDDDCVSQSSYSSFASSYSSFASSYSSARRLSPPPGHRDRLTRMQAPRPGLLQGLVDTIASLLSAPV